MPLLWRYLISNYFKVFLLCIVAFIAILLTMRLEEIASFITLGAPANLVIWFVLQQIPYILPIAIPISALIAAVLLVQNLSDANELTALRACGFSLRDILFPLLIASLFLSALNFYIISELATSSHLQTSLLKKQLRSVNPLLLIQNKHLMNLKGFYFDVLGPSHVGEFAQDILFFSPGKHGNRMTMMTAKQLKSSTNEFTAENITLLTGQYNPETKKETIIIENSATSQTPINNFPLLTNKTTWAVYNDHLTLPQLLVRLNESKQSLASPKVIHGVYTEILRRLSISIAVFSFTLMGLAFGISISRNQTNRGLILIIALGSLFIVCFFTAKHFNHALIPAALLYLLPHLIIWAASIRILRRVAHGIE